MRYPRSTDAHHSHEEEALRQLDRFYGAGVTQAPGEKAASLSGGTALTSQLPSHLLTPPPHASSSHLLLTPPLHTSSSRHLFTPPLHATS